MSLPIPLLTAFFLTSRILVETSDIWKVNLSKIYSFLRLLSLSVTFLYVSMQTLLRLYYLFITVPTLYPTAKPSPTCLLHVLACRYVFVCVYMQVSFLYVLKLTSMFSFVLHSVFKIYFFKIFSLTSMLLCSNTAHFF